MSVDRVEFLLGNIAESDCEAIVNPCNSGFLLGYAGVNGALAAAAGPDYAAECARLPESLGADVLVTGAGQLKARIVIHAVSPIWNAGERGEREVLRRMHERVLEVASDCGCGSLALPAIGTGAHHFPAEVAARVAVPAVEEALPRHLQLERVCFVFTRRTILHDYLTQSRHGDASDDAATEALRQEITTAVRASGDAALASAVADLNENELRAIETTARELTRTYEQRAGSLSVSTLYTLAARQVLAVDADSAAEGR